MTVRSNKPIYLGAREEKVEDVKSQDGNRLINVLLGTLSFRVQTKLPLECGSLAR